ncbi:hypothetical protein [Mongoliimonas terrestris]|uniref:hypothetical protein n=1 Tax=Mongoliimonas terrestris TaxID=1709001 RepID=UPI0011152561|nr:hypothetical protein [Mongoliimonas terrestris]
MRGMTLAALLFAAVAPFAVASAPAVAAECGGNTNRPCDQRTQRQEILRDDRREARRPGNLHRDAEVNRYLGAAPNTGRPCVPESDSRRQTSTQPAPGC